MITRPNSLGRTLAHPAWSLGALVVMAALTFWGFDAFGRFATEDSAYVFVTLSAITILLIWPVYLWHLTYLAVTMGRPSKLRQNLAIALFFALPVLTLVTSLGVVPLDLRGGFQLVWQAMAVTLLGLAARGLTRAFGTTSKLSFVGYIFAVWFVPFTGYLYFDSVHRAQSELKESDVTPGSA